MTLTRRFLLPIFVGLAVAAWAGAAPAQDAGDVSLHPWIGNAAPAFSLKTTGGETMSLGDLKGRYVVIHFGASW